MHSIEDDQGNVHIYWGCKRYYSFNRSNSFERRLGVALLAKLGVLRRTITELFDVTRHTALNILRVYESRGAEGLLDYKQGPTPVGEELKAFVIKKYVELDGKRGYQNCILGAIEKKVGEGIFGKVISRSKLQQIIRGHKDDVRRQKAEAAERKEALERQKEEDKREAEEERETIEEEKRQLELGLGDREEEQCVQHGGAAAAIPVVQEFGLKGFLPDDQEGKDRLFGNSELTVSYAALNAAELVEVEQDFKLLPSYQMGGIIGRVKLPSLSLYRERIPQVVEQMDMQEVMLETSRRAHKVFGFSEVVYIDGHFMPYYGGSPTLYGYNPQKRLAMHGREYFFVHDRDGMPIYATMSDGYRKMRHYIEDVDAKVREIFGVGERQLLEVFDRGGYSKEFCIGINSKIRFVCWRSDGRTVPVIGAAEWVKLFVQLEPNELGEEKERKLGAWERKVEFEVDGRKAEFRELWIKDGKKVSPALTNDTELSLEEVVAALVRRWGAQENMFKELKDHGIDRIHSYRKQEYTEEYLYERGLETEQQGVCHEIENPKVRQLNKEIRKLRLQEERLAKRMAALEENNSNKDLLTALKRKASGVKRKITIRLKKRDGLPKNVRMMDRIEEENIVRIADQKKLFFDWLKMNAVWAKRQLVEIAKPYYRDLRDVNKFVRSILRSRTYMSRQDKRLTVSFPPQRSKRGSAALAAICEHLNTKPAVDLGLSFDGIRFRVGQKH